MSLHIYLFGGFRLEGAEGPLPAIASRSGRSLLAYLVMHQDRPHTRDLLAGMFWPEVSETRARRRLSQILWQIRQALAPLDPQHTYLLADAETVQFDGAKPYRLDVQAFEGNLRQAGANQDRPPTQTISLLAEATALYSGDFMAGYYDDWVRIEQERLGGLYLEALERLVALCKSQGLYEDALAHATRLARHDPLHEEAHREIMRLCFLLGRWHEALQQYERCRKLFAQELGLEPSPATTDLYHEIQTHMAQGTPRKERSLVAEPAESPAFAGAQVVPFVGRKEERAALVRAVEGTLAGRGGVVLVEGESGVGKTRLLQEAAEDATWRGCQVLSGQGHEHAELAPYGLLREALAQKLTPLRARQLAELVEGVWLREASQVIPELARWLPDLPPHIPLNPEYEQSRLLEALSQVLLALEQIGPHLLILDDAQWADEGTLDVLAYLAPRLNQRRMLVVASYRSLAGRARQALWDRLRALDQVAGRGRLSLARLDAGETGELVRRGLRLTSHAPKFESRLYQASRGNPLFVLETLRALHDANLLYQDETGDWRTPWDEMTDDYAELPISPQLQRVISARLARLAPDSRAILAATAVLGDDFDFGLLCQASQAQSGVVLQAMNDLLHRGLLIEQEAAYQFSHDQIRQVAYGEIAAAERRALHRRAAQALEATHPERVSALAYHFEQAEVWDKASRYHQRAGNRAQAVYANAEAVAHYSQALAAEERLPGPADPDRIFALRLAREAVYALQGQRAEQRQDLEALAQQLDEAAEPAVARRAEVLLRQIRYALATGAYAPAIETAQTTIGLAQKIGDVACEATSELYCGQARYRQGNYAAAKAHLEQALALIESMPGELPAVEAASLLTLGNIQADRGDKSQAEAHYQQALQILQETDDRRSAASPLNSLALLNRSRGDLAEARGYWEQALQIAREVGDRYTESLVLGNLSGAAMDLGEYAQARDHLEQALVISRDITSRIGEGAWLYALGMVSLGQGDPAQARIYAEQALRILRETGIVRHEAWALWVLGQSYHRVGDYERADEVYHSSLRISQEVGDQENEGQVLAYLGLLAHHRGDDEAAWNDSRRALQIMQASGERYTQGVALTNLGHALSGLDRWPEAAQAYRQALELQRSLGQANLAIAAQAGLADVSLAQGSPAQALELVEGILRHLAQGTLAGTNEPLRIYLTCYRVLCAVRDPRAQEVLSAAYEQLQQWAEQLDEELVRHSFLERVAVHREIVALWLVTCSRRTLVRLAQADTPTGRALRDDEWLEVTWTVAEPADESVRGKKARRQHRLLRLLRQAEEQGGAPTVDDLAQALDASPATIKRDLAALRVQGHEVITRGSRGP